MNEHEYYVSPELLKLLKEAGFDWEIFDGYITYENGHGFTTRLQNPHNFNGDNGDLFINYRGYKEVFSRPTLEVAQRWLREVKGIEFDLCWHLTLDNQYKYAYAIKIKSIWKGLDKGKEIEVPSMDCLEAETCFDTYEEAQEAGIKKALEIILEK